MPTNNHSLIHHIILAGGEGRRMGGCDKCLQLYEGQPLYKYVANSTLGLADDVVMVGNFYGSPATDIRRVDDIDAGQGPLSGLNTLVAQNLTGTLLISACDMPKLTLDVWRALLLEYQAHRPVYAKTAESHFHLVMVCDASHLIEARNLFEQGCRKPKVWIDTINAHAVELESLKECFANYNAIT